MKFFLLMLGVFGLIAPANAQHEAEGKATHIPHGPHHLSILLADTRIDGEGNNSTLGIDYEYRVSPLIGLGGVIEHAYGGLDATTLLAVADIHIYEGFTVQVGPGFEHRKIKHSPSLKRPERYFSYILRATRDLPPEIGSRCLNSFGSGGNFGKFWTGRAHFISLNIRKASL